MANVQMLRIETKLKELFENKIDFSDVPDSVDQFFSTRALAALYCSYESIN